MSEDKIDMVFDLLKEVRQDQIKIRDGQMEILSNGCPTGARNKEILENHESRLKKLEGIVGKGIAVGLILVGGTAGGMKIIEMIIGG